MQHIIVGKQHNSRMCFVCGLKNGLGLKASFFETDTNELVALFRPADGHQSYPGRLHGGVSAAILDETIGRAIMIGRGTEVWGVTLEFTIKFRKPLPLDRELKVVGRVTGENSRFFEGSGEILLEDGTVAASASGRYIKVPLSKITDSNFVAEDWRLVDGDSIPQTL